MKEIIIFAILGYWFAEITLIPQNFAVRFLKRKSFKPFTCGLCFTFWFALTMNYHLPIQQMIIHSILSSFSCVIIQSIHNAINRI